MGVLSAFNKCPVSDFTFKLLLCFLLKVGQVSHVFKATFVLLNIFLIVFLSSTINKLIKIINNDNDNNVTGSKMIDLN